MATRGASRSLGRKTAAEGITTSGREAGQPGEPGEREEGVADAGRGHAG